ncbi:MAG: CvpA family protein [Desulfobacter sp.]|nr:CvpA family protein [Desulfobacter sp.]WDP87107.1 MAG: CvpA family protein [Desulfobacter sp.]
MNFFDLGVAVIVGFCLIRGGFRGLIGEVSGIIGVMAGFYGANTYYLQLVPYVEPWGWSADAQELFCFFALFCLILILVGLLSFLIRKLLRLVFLGWVDRVFGVVFGTAKGILIVTILFIMATAFASGTHDRFKDSKTAPYLAQVADTLTLFVSQNMKTDFYQHLEGLKKEWKL